MNHKLTYLFTGFCLILLTTPACTRNGIGSGSGGVSLPAASGNTGAGTTAAAAISENDKPADAMTRAMRAQLDAKSYRAHVTTTMADGTTNKMLIEYAAPDRFRMTGEGQTGDESAGKSFKVEYVIVGGATYVKMPNAGWTKSPIDARPMLKAFRDPKMLDELAKTAEVKLVGPDTLDGAPMLVYQYTQNNALGMNIKSHSKTWLAVADGLPRKTETEGEFDGKKTKTLITMSDYNADIKIEAPVQ